MSENHVENPRDFFVISVLNLFSSFYMNERVIIKS